MLFYSIKTTVVSQIGFVGCLQLHHCGNLIVLFIIPRFVDFLKTERAVESFCMFIKFFNTADNDSFFNSVGAIVYDKIPKVRATADSCLACAKLSAKLPPSPLLFPKTNLFKGVCICEKNFCPKFIPSMFLIISIYKTFYSEFCKFLLKKIKVFLKNADKHDVNKEEGW